MALFQNSVLKKYLSAQEQAPMHAAFGAYLNYFHDPLRRANIRASKEEQFQEGFLRELFVNILGYTINPDPDFNLTTELKNIKDSKKTDGAIIKDGKAIAVIELKGTDTKDLEKIRDQAFNYKNNHPDCIYVITSNFEKLRFYIHNAVDYYEFSILHMQQEEFRMLWLLLQKDNLLKGIPQKIKAESLIVEEQVTKKLYSDYSAFKQELWQDMVAQNPGQDELLLYKKSQKLLDRFLFIFFAEDKGLLPPNSISEIIKQWQTLEHLDSYVPLYDRFKLYFGFMNTGRPARKDKAEIHAYNGGLFAPDELLDSLTISDILLKTHVLKLTEYDFESEVDTNILGHIFEHSLNDIENVRASLEGTTVDKSKTKRKKDGVFYTPKYITKYIVDNTVGKLCTEKKAELGIIDEDFAKGKAGRKKDTLLKLVSQLKAYREWLLQLAICDPACGSGAFLNQVLEFLMAEHRYLDELESMLFGSSIVFPNVENHILENNIFGVDINEESVEIARLSLWLRTAQKGRKLSTLSSNIKVGNSLIDDPEVAGDLAFDWQNQFPKVFAKGGFDVVVGNPPYVRQELITPFKPFFQKIYKTFAGTADLYTYFIEKGVDNLINTEGYYSIIVANKWMRAQFGKPLRKWMKTKDIVEIIDFGDLPVFADATAYPCILTLKKENIIPQNSISACEPKDLKFSDLQLLVSQTSFEIEKSQLNDEGWSLTNRKISSLIEKLKRSGTPLEEFVKNGIYRGVLTGLNEAFVIDIETKDKLIEQDFKSQEIIKPFLAGRDVKRYHFDFQERYLIFTRRGIDIEKYPAVKSHLERFRIQLEPKPKDWEGDWEGRKSGSYKWFEIQDSIEYHEEFEKPKIIYPNICSGPQFCLDNGKYFTNQKCFIIPNFGYELLGVLNSKLFYFLFSQLLPKLRGGFFEPSYVYLKDFPIKVFRMENEILKIELLTRKIGECVNIVSQFSKHIKDKWGLLKISQNIENWPSLDFKGFLGELKKAKVKLSLSEEAEWMAYFNEQKSKAQALQSDISRIDREIDALVYELYGLTEEEIRIVEGGE